MQLEIAARENSLDSLLDKIVNGEKIAQTFNLVLRDVSPNVLMQIVELIETERGKILLKRAPQETIAA